MSTTSGSTLSTEERATSTSPADVMTPPYARAFSVPLRVPMDCVSSRTACHEKDVVVTAERRQEDEGSSGCRHP